jgi:DNA-binding transcriptional LysR family regulator
VEDGWNQINGNAAVGLLSLVRRMTSGNGSKDGNVAAEADSFVALRALVESEAVAAVLPEGLVKTFSLKRLTRSSAKELDGLRRELVVACNARSASLRPAIHQATQQLANL